MQGKLNPQNGAKISFPGFQEIFDFTSDGTSGSTSCTVDGNTDKELILLIRNFQVDELINVFLNNDQTGANYGRQYLYNSTGSLSAGTGTGAPICDAKGMSKFSILVPSSMLKTIFNVRPFYSSGSTLTSFMIDARSWNNTANVTSLNFLCASSANFTAGTRITIYARRSNT